jgi:hypothetical protein
MTPSQSTAPALLPDAFCERASDAPGAQGEPFRALDGPGSREDLIVRRLSSWLRAPAMGLAPSENSRQTSKAEAEAALAAFERSRPDGGPIALWLRSPAGIVGGGSFSRGDGWVSCASARTQTPREDVIARLEASGLFDARRQAVCEWYWGCAPANARPENFGPQARAMKAEDADGRPAPFEEMEAQAWAWMAAARLPRNERRRDHDLRWLLAWTRSLARQAPQEVERILPEAFERAMRETACEAPRAGWAEELTEKQRVARQLTERSRACAAAASAELRAQGVQIAPWRLTATSCLAARRGFLAWERARQTQALAKRARRASRLASLEEAVASGQMTQDEAWESFGSLHGERLVGRQALARASLASLDAKALRWLASEGLFNTDSWRWAAKAGPQALELLMGGARRLAEKEGPQAAAPKAAQALDAMMDAGFDFMAHARSAHGEENPFASSARVWGALAKTEPSATAWEPLAAAWAQRIAAQARARGVALDTLAHWATPFADPSRRAAGGVLLMRVASHCVEALALADSVQIARQGQKAEAPAGAPSPAEPRKAAPRL